MEILFSAVLLIMVYTLLFAARKRRLRAMERAKKLSWDRNVEKMYGRWHTY